MIGRLVAGGGAKLIQVAKPHGHKVSESTLTDIQAGDNCFLHRFKALTEVLEFGNIDVGWNFLLTGVHVSQSHTLGLIET